jgi:hypothetical protein
MPSPEIVTGFASAPNRLPEAIRSPANRDKLAAVFFISGVKNDPGESAGRVTTAWAFPLDSQREPTL